MTTCTWNFRRHAGRVLAVALSAALTSGLVLPSASADQISDLRAQAAAIAAKINALGQQEETLAERYDQAQMELTGLKAKEQQAHDQLAAAQSQTDRARQALKADAVQAYLNGGANPLSAGAGAMQSANLSLLRAEYVNTLATDQTNAIDQYHLASLQEQAAEANLKQQSTAKDAQVRQLDGARNAVSRTSAQLQATETQVKGQLAQAVAAEQAAEAAAAARAAQARLAALAAAQAAEAAQRQQALAAEAAAAAARSAVASRGAVSGNAGSASSSGGGAAATVTAYNAPPVGAGAAGALAAAESRIGDPYVWGASGPSAFDCSGLVMWAYAQVGISLPHFSGAQYASTTHIPMSALQPGDLVFFGDPGEHVAMYVGNGQIIEAPHTGATVHIVPMYGMFVLAGRVQ